MKTSLKLGEFWISLWLFCRCHFRQFFNYMYIVSTTIIRIVVRSRPSTPHDATWAPTIKLIITSNLFSNISKCKFLYRNPSTAWRKKCHWFLVILECIICIPLYKLFIKVEKGCIMYNQIWYLKTQWFKYFIITTILFCKCLYQR